MHLPIGEVFLAMVLARGCACCRSQRHSASPNSACDVKIPPPPRRLSRCSSEEVPCRPFDRVPACRIVPSFWRFNIARRFFVLDAGGNWLADILTSPEWMVLLVGIGRPFCPKAVTFLLGGEAGDGDVRSRPEAALHSVAKYIGVSAGFLLGMRDRQCEDAYWRCMAGVLSGREWMVPLVRIGRPFYPKAVTFLLGPEARDGDVRGRPEAAFDGVTKYIGVPADIVSFLILGVRDRQGGQEHRRDKDCGDQCLESFAGHGHFPLINARTFSART